MSWQCLQCQSLGLKFISLLENVFKKCASKHFVLQGKRQQRRQNAQVKVDEDEDEPDLSLRDESSDESKVSDSEDSVSEDESGAAMTTCAKSPGFKQPQKV